MPRLISCAETIPAVLDKSKTVTRRLGWWEDRNGRRLVVPGDQLTICGQVMGRKPGQPITRYATVPILNVRREPLRAIADWDIYGDQFAEVYREGVADEVLAWRDINEDRWPNGDMPDLDQAFCLWYEQTFSCPWDVEVTRIEWTWDGAIFHDGMTT